MLYATRMTRSDPAAAPGLPSGPARIVSLLPSAIDEDVEIPSWGGGEAIDGQQLHSVGGAWDEGGQLQRPFVGTMESGIGDAVAGGLVSWTGEVDGGSGIGGRRDLRTAGDSEPW